MPSNKYIYVYSIFYTVSFAIYIKVASQSAV